MPLKKTSWTNEFWSWLKGPGTVVIGFAVCLFVAGKIYGSDTTDMRNALSVHTTQLQASTAQEQTLNASIMELTKATKAMGDDQTATRSAMVEIIRALIPLVKSGESKQRLREVLDGMKKISEVGPSNFAGGDLLPSISN